MKKALVTGGKGFIGRRLVKKLESLGYDVFVCQDILGPFKWDVDIVFHLAAYGNSPEENDSTEIYNVNVLGTSRLLEKLSVKVPVVFASSSSVYGSRSEGSLMREGDKLSPNSHYAASKICAENMLILRGNSTRLRLFSVYGPGEAVYRLIPTVSHKARNDRDVEIDEYAVRDFIHVDDVVEAMIQLSDFHGTFNVGSGREWKVSDVAKIILAMFPNSSSKYISLNQHIRPWESAGWRADISAAKACDWEPKINFLDGLKDYVENYSFFIKD